MNIGIFGAPLCDPNLGCVALCYSMLVMLERIRKKNNLDFHYIIFDYQYDKKNYDALSKNLNISMDSISYCKRGNISDPLRILKHFSGIIEMKKGLKRCDVVIDLTEGDSFSDIYGDVIFRGKTNVKLLIEKMGVPLILGPQTYGPFYKKNNKSKAQRAIQKAYLVIARDDMSAECVRNLGRENVLRTIDLAFMLPYKSDKLDGEKIKIGINVSSMLYFERNEMKVQRFSMRANYKECIETIIDKLLANDEYDVYLVPHVNLDVCANNEIKKRFPGVICVEHKDNPMEIKSVISSMDFFIGARMHATIAAVSSGIPCIPMSYSRKFLGLFETLGYNHVLNLEKQSTDEIIENLIEKINNYDQIKENVEECKIVYEQMTEKTVATFEEILMNINLNYGGKYNVEECN